MAKQLVFELPANTTFEREDFFTAPTNSLALEAIENWPSWPLNKLVLTGPEGAGKTHLAHIWAKASQGRMIEANDLLTEMPEVLIGSPICVENVPFIAGVTIAEENLFHLYNLAQETGTPLLMTGRGNSKNWGIALPDLASRLQGSNTVALRPPGDFLLSAVLVKLFSDCQLRVEPGLIAYLMPRMERSFGAARKLVNALDKQALQDKRPIGVKMARLTLESLNMES